MNSPGVVRQLLALETGDVATPDLIAEGAARACEKIAHRLAPLIGSAGIQSLFARSLRLASAQFPWLAAAATTAPASAWTQLRSCIEEQPTAAAAEASEALVGAFVGLLETFIGSGLTARLLHDVWPGVFPTRSSKELT